MINISISISIKTMINTIIMINIAAVVRWLPAWLTLRLLWWPLAECSNASVFLSIYTITVTSWWGDSISNQQPHDCLLNRLCRRRSKKSSKLRVTGLCAGNSPATGEFPAQTASSAENVSIWWRHHECVSVAGSLLYFVGLKLTTCTTTTAMFFYHYPIIVVAVIAVFINIIIIGNIILVIYYL